MIVGFTIIDFKGNERKAAEYIQKVCILEDLRIAQNIVAAGPGVNVFSNAIILSELQAQPFLATPIEVQEGKYLVVSSVNFNLELSFNNRVLKLAPTEYIYVELDEVQQFEKYFEQGLVRVIPEVTSEGKKWILDEGSWDDEGVWTDSNYWRD